MAVLAKLICFQQPLKTTKKKKKKKRKEIFKNMKKSGTKSQTSSNQKTFIEPTIINHS